MLLSRVKALVRLVLVGSIILAGFGGGIAIVPVATIVPAHAQTAGGNGSAGGDGNADTLIVETEEAIGWLEERLPDYLVTPQFLNVTVLQWIALAVLVILASALGFLTATVALRLAYSMASRTRSSWDEFTLNIATGPVRFMLSVVFFYFGALILGLSSGVESTIATVCKIAGVLSVVWFLARLTDGLSAYAERRFEEKGKLGAKTLAPMGRRVTKIFILIVAALSLVQNLGFNVTGLIAGLGIGGIAIAFAAQKSLENLFGGIMVLADRPVSVGDRCLVGEHFGVVEDIGLRSSRIRTLDRTLVTIPNSDFSTVRIENYTAREKIRIHEILQIGYDTSPDQVRYLLVEIRKMLYAHAKTLDDPCRIRLVNFGAYSLDLEIFVYVDTQDWNEFLAIREDIFLRIMDIVKQSGAYFAYPSQTLYLGRDAGRDMESTQAAERQVEELRARARLPLPEFPHDELEKIANSLDYPPSGSVSHPQQTTDGQRAS